MIVRLTLILLAIFVSNRAAAVGTPAAALNSGALPDIPQRYIVMILVELAVLVLVTVLILIKVRRIGRK